MEGNAAADRLAKIGRINKNLFDFKTDDTRQLERELKFAETILNDFYKNSDGTINLELEGAQDVQTIIATLITRKQELEKPAIMSVDLSEESYGDGSVEDFLVKLQTLQSRPC